jgi:transposase-like protein
MDEAENDVLVHMSFPEEHWQQIYSTNPLERTHPGKAALCAGEG